MTTEYTEYDDQFEYDLALSFTDQDRGAVEAFTNLLQDQSLRIFHDEIQAGALQKEDMLEHLVNLYKRKSRYCVLFLSPAYPLKTWTAAEQTAVQGLALRDAHKYILALPLESGKTPGDRKMMESLIRRLEDHWHETVVHPGPPPESHDLRSGNVPSVRQKP